MDNSININISINVNTTINMCPQSVIMMSTNDKKGKMDKPPPLRFLQQQDCVPKLQHQCDRHDWLEPWW